MYLFQQIASTDPERSRFYLESANWNLDVAVSAFFENEGDGFEQLEIPPEVAEPKEKEEEEDKEDKEE